MEEKKEKNGQQGEKNKCLSKHETESVMRARQQLLVLLYKDIYFSTNDLHPSFPSGVVYLLQDFDYLFC